MPRLDIQDMVSVLRQALQYPVFGVLNATAPFILQSLFLMCLSNYPSNFGCFFTMDVPAASHIIYKPFFKIDKISLILCI